LNEKEKYPNMYHHLVVTSIISYSYAGSRKTFKPVTTKELKRNGAHDDSETAAS
jgi:hypothetical protein